jgi:YrbI family 3-deoxy-D-manno-octulosonate 8-phosphate phosphatase
MSVVRQGCRDKAAALREIMAEQGVAAREVAYVGDDINDLPVMEAVGLSAAPADATFEVRAAAFMVLDARGGQGCLREFVEAILRARGDWERAAAKSGVPLPGA